MSVERFAPSPTGRLHLGHAFSALTAWYAARAEAGGRFLIRMEDLDRGRVRAAHEESILEDLQWLGIDWDGVVLRQSERVEAYREALSLLAEQAVLYPCQCSRRDIAEAVSAPQEGAHSALPRHGPDGLVYPGTCRPSAAAVDIDKGVSGHLAMLREGAALRLDMRRAVAALGGTATVSMLHFDEVGAGPAGEAGRVSIDPEVLVEGVGDVVLRRRDGAVAYHLAVVVDDAHQGVTCVTRGEDLFEATQIHRILQALLGLPTPRYRHHRLIRDAAGRRLAKRDDARSLAILRADGWTPSDIRRSLGWPG